MMVNYGKLVANNMLNLVAAMIWGKKHQGVSQNPLSQFTGQP